MLRVEIIKDCIADGVKHKKGSDVQLPNAIANKLIDRGFAKVYKAQKNVD